MCRTCLNERCFCFVLTTNQRASRRTIFLLFSFDGDKDSNPHFITSSRSNGSISFVTIKDYIPTPQAPIFNTFPILHTVYFSKSYIQPTEFPSSTLVIVSSASLVSLDETTAWSSLTIPSPLFAVSSVTGPMWPESAVSL